MLLEIDLNPQRKLASNIHTFSFSSSRLTQQVSLGVFKMPEGQCCKYIPEYTYIVPPLVIASLISASIPQNVSYLVHNNYTKFSKMLHSFW